MFDGHNASIRKQLGFNEYNASIRKQLESDENNASIRILPKNFNTNIVPVILKIPAKSLIIPDLSMYRRPRQSKSHVTKGADCSTYLKLSEGDE